MATVRDHAALVALLDARMRAPLAWGRNDHVVLAADAARACAGVRLRRAFGCRWTTADAAARAIARRGGLAAVLDAHLTPVPPAMAQRGDLGLVRIDGAEVLAIVEGHLLATPGAHGLARLPRAALAAAWSLDRAQ